MNMEIMDNGRRTRSAKERFWWFGQKYHQYLKVYLADLPNWTKPLGYWWKRLHRASLVRGMYHQENASTLWAFNVNEKMQILPLHIKSIVNLNFTRAHESTSPNACTRRCVAAVSLLCRRRSRHRACSGIYKHIFCSFQMIQDDAHAILHTL